MFGIKLRNKNPFVSINNIEIDVDIIPDNSLTIEQWKAVRANTDGFEALYPKLNNEALIYAVNHNLNNCSRKDNIVYEGALQNLLVPLLLKRLKEKGE